MNYYLLWLTFTCVFGISEIWINYVYNYYDPKDSQIIPLDILLIFASSIISSTAFNIWTSGRHELNLNFIWGHIMYPLISITLITIIYINIIESPTLSQSDHFIEATYTIVITALIYGSIGAVRLYEGQDEQNIIEGS